MRKILEKQLKKVNAHYIALREYKEYIDKSSFDFSVDEFKLLNIETKAVLEAYLKRFSSLQDYIGAKVFKSLLDVSGISYSKMSEVLALVEKEEIVNLDIWIEFRNIRNDLEHDYPDELEEALHDLKYCVDSFNKLESVIKRVFEFAKRYNATL